MTRHCSRKQVLFISFYTCKLLKYSFLEITFIKNIDWDQHITDISPKANNDLRFPLRYLAFAHKSKYGQYLP